MNKPIYGQAPEGNPAKIADDKRPEKSFFLKRNKQRDKTKPGE
jgi:hypothetical protein